MNPKIARTLTRMVEATRLRMDDAAGQRARWLARLPGATVRRVRRPGGVYCLVEATVPESAVGAFGAGRATVSLADPHGTRFEELEELRGGAAA